MNWRSLMFWRRSKEKTFDLLPSREILARQDANQKFLKEKGSTWKFVREEYLNLDLTGVYLAFTFMSLMFGIVTGSVFLPWFGSSIEVLILTNAIGCFTAVMGYLVVNDLHIRYQYYMVSLQGTRKALEGVSTYYERIKAEYTKKIMALGKSKWLAYSGHLDGILCVIEESEKVHEFNCGGSCDICRCLADARRVGADLLSRMDAIEEKEKSLISRADNLIDRLADEEQKQITYKAEILEQNRQIREDVDRALDIVGGRHL
ncbi:MAG: hypothetical protein Q7S19_02615 [bacterium]|nr:hypothetical protein [bacterium]